MCSICDIIYPSYHFRLVGRLNNVKTFDYSFLVDIQLPVKFITIVGSIYELRERMNWRKGQKKYDEKFADLENLTKIQSVKHSNTPESLEVADKRINGIIYQNSPPAQNNKVEVGIAGYHNAVNLIYAKHTTLDVRKDDILKIHKTLWSYYSDSSVSVGNYRRTSIPDKEGETIVWYTAPLPEIVQNMEQLEQAYIDARRNDNINKLLLIPCLALDFLSVRPFDKDSNGRMAMLLSLLLLYKNGFGMVRYISFEEQIHRNPMYQQVINVSLAKQESQDNDDYIPFIEQFLTTVLSCYTELEGQFPKLSDSKLPTVQQIGNIIGDSPVAISKNKIQELLPHLSVTTIEKHLGYLVRNGIIEKVGKAQNTKYVKK